MPIFEFKCGKCGHLFEKLSKMADKSAKCPTCSKQADKIFSTFNAIGISPSSKCSSAEFCPSAGKSCCPSETCSLHK